ncbi:hypothetical protein ACFLU4_06200 [Chloroflexota bacterium]
MAKEKETESAESQKETLDPEYVKRQLEMFDQRLDNIDSMVSAVIERLMSQPMAINITCPHCGKNIEVALIGNTKPGR